MRSGRARPLSGALLALTLVSAVARADPPAAPAATMEEPVPTPWDGLGDDLVNAFTGTNLAFYGAAVAATGAMAFSGADQRARVFAQTAINAPAYGDFAVAAGYVLPLVIAPALYGTGLFAHDRDLAGAGAAALQALAVAASTTAILKWTTGRPFPNHGGDPHAADRLDHPEYAREFGFRPFTWHTELAWPSGHTSATMSIAAAVAGYYSDQTWIIFVGYPASLLVGAGMVVGDHHWASDVVAGALIGHAVGYSIGRDFRLRSQNGQRALAPTVRLYPMPGVTLGLAVGGTF